MSAEEQLRAVAVAALRDAGIEAELFTSPTGELIMNVRGDCIDEGSDQRGRITTVRTVCQIDLPVRVDSERAKTLRHSTLAHHLRMIANRPRDYTRPERDALIREAAIRLDGLQKYEEQLPQE